MKIYKFIFLTALTTSLFGQATSDKSKLTEVEAAKIETYKAQAATLASEQSNLDMQNNLLQTSKKAFDESLDNFVKKIEQNHPGMTLDKRTGELIPIQAKQDNLQNPPVKNPQLNTDPRKKK